MGIVNVGSTLGGLAGGAATARLLVVISGQTAGLTTALSQAQGQLATFNGTASQLGNALIRGLSLPALAVGGTALKMAADFESAMARVQGLTTIQADEFAEAGDRILDLARKYPTAPNELADALYFAGSAGLNFSTAMEVVEASAGAAAIGMGEANDVAKILIFSLNAYKSAGLTAARAMDVFAAAIKEGTADPDELALALGRLLPVAEEAGVTFEQAVGSIASLTNIGLPTRVASTSLRALFGGLLAPTQQANERLQELGTTSEELRTVLSQGGPLAAFTFIERLARSSDDYHETIRRIIPQIRAFTAYLGVGNERAKKSADIFREVTNSAGDYERALKIIRQTQTYRFGQALNELRVAGIEVGTALFPIFTQLGHVIAGFGEVIQAMPPWMTEAAAAAIGLAAAIGPLIKLWGAVNVATGAAATASIRMFATIKSSIAAIGMLGIALGVAGLGMASMSENGVNLGNTMSTLVGTFGTAFIALQALRRLVLSGFFVRFGSTIAGAMYSITAAAGPVAIAIAGVVTAFMMIRNRGRAAAKEAEEFGDALVSAGQDALLTKRFLEELKETTSEDVGQTFIDALKSADKIGVSLSRGIQPARKELAGMALEVIKTSDAIRLWGQDEALSPFIHVLEEAKGHAIDLTEVLHRSGLRVSDLMDLISKEGFGSTAFDAMATEQRKALTAIFATSRELQQVYRENNALAQSQVINYAAEGAAIADVAAKYNVSGKEVKAAMQQYAIPSVQGLTEQTWQLIAAERKWISQTGEVTGMAFARLQAERKIIAERQKALRDNALGKLFEKDVATVDRSTADLVASAQRQAQAMVATARGTQTLLGRGLDPAVLQFLVDQGPEMVRKFVNASDSELKKLESSYFQTLNAVDAAILKEGDHEEVKGRANVQKFANGMLSSDLPVRAAIEITNRVTTALASGRLGKVGFAQIKSFAHHVMSAKGISNESAATLINEFAQTIIEGDLEGAGDTAIRKFTAGLSSAAGLPKGKASQIAAIVKSALSIDASGAGRSVVGSFVDGFVGAIPVAVDQVSAAARQMKDGFQESLKNSPKFFTYYAGRELVRQLNEGLDQGRIHHIGRPKLDGRRVRMHGGRRDSAGGRGGDTNIIIYADSLSDERKIAHAVRGELSGAMHGTGRVNRVRRGGTN